MFETNSVESNVVALNNRTSLYIYIYYFFFFIYVSLYRKIIQKFYVNEKKNICLICFLNIFPLGLKVDVQTMVEKPEMYILTRCTSDKNQLLYSPLRLEDMESCNKSPIKFNNIDIFDEIRFFKGW